ncbi:glucokinase [Alkalinema sp. FACHB-956]|uniref:glucokinase n=1 Tax=Alkalinema sp. FACHB-956 TaxID=2692768 RepID=UPI00168823D6|nr:glucokinase [Alkalinema sp. FACHB-956]MBD2329911.1 glucokinase [Alkalinema sp. FACHB-956]
MTLLLAGDIGGTKTILRLVDLVSDADWKTVYEMRYLSGEYPDLVPMVTAFLDRAQAEVGKPEAGKPEAGNSLSPAKACFAIAGPVVNNTSKLTNLGWLLAADRLSEELKIPKVSLINDFAAVGYGVLGLQDQDLCTLQVGESESTAPIAVIGAGTGLGQGFLIHSATGYQVFSSEGGHVDFAPRSEIEYQLSRYLLDKFNIDRLSVERVVSGQGIVSIYQFLRDRNYATETPEIAAAIRQWEAEAGQSEKTVDPGSIIGAAALAGSDRLCQQALQLFVEAYGSEAGNLALKLLPYGGLYIAGGIAAKILPLMQSGPFLQAFAHKGRMSPLLERIPVHVVLNPQVGLIGAALCAARL